ncbi:MAG: DNA polymerase III subunit beta [bacterium]|nr:DNA polymerase III subunit beta [bacterium]
MKITIAIKKFNEVIDIANRFVAKNATLPILQNIYLKASIDSLILRATDMEKFVEIEIPCQIAIEGAITVNAKMFADILKTVEDEQIEISSDEKTHILQIKTTKDTFDINGISASEYIALPEIPQDNKITLDTTGFSEGISKVEYAVTEKNFSPILTGVMFKSKKENEEQKLIFVGTDSFRLAEYKITSDQLDEDFALIIPKVSINDIQKIIEYAKDHNTEDFQIHYSENLIAFSCQIDDIKILATSLLIQGNFPDYDREDIMPKSFNTTIMVDKHLCEKSIKKIAILTRDINNFIQVETEENNIIISSGKTDKGAGTTSIPAIIS